MTRVFGRQRWEFRLGLYKQIRIAGRDVARQAGSFLGTSCRGFSTIRRGRKSDGVSRGDDGAGRAGTTAGPGQFGLYVVCNGILDESFKCERYICCKGRLKPGWTVTHQVDGDVLQRSNVVADGGSRCGSPRRG